MLSSRRRKARILVNPLDSADGGRPDDGVAVAGLACPPPQAHDVRAFWHLLTSGSHALTEIPAAHPRPGARHDRGPAGQHWAGAASRSTRWPRERCAPI